MSLRIIVSSAFFFKSYGDHRDLHVLTHSFPTRRASDLGCCGVRLMNARASSASRGHSGACCSPCPATRDKIRAPPQNCWRSEEHTSELQSLMRISYAVFCLKKKTFATSNIQQPINRYKTDYKPSPHLLHSHALSK